MKLAVGGVGETFPQVGTGMRRSKMARAPKREEEERRRRRTRGQKVSKVRRGDRANQT